MEKIEQIIIIAANGLGLLATFTGFLIPLIKNVKAKNKLVAINKLTSTLQTLIIEAEEFTMQRIILLKKLQIQLRPL